MLVWSRSANRRIGWKSNAKLARPMGTVVGEELLEVVASRYS
jgi:hypothetical protein